MTLEHVVAFLICPHCGADLGLDGRVVSCGNGHRYDVARQGYVNLLPGGARTASADTAAMVAAREAFFAAGHFAPLLRAVTDEVGRVVADGPPGCVVDLGSGPGHYLAAALDAWPGRAGIALDLSKHALRRAARLHPRIGAVVCDAWRPLPVATGAAALVLNVFAPRNGAEIRRMLRPGGALLVITPTTDHLREIMPALRLLTVDEHKRDRLERQLAGHLTVERETPVVFPMSLDAAEVEALVAMGPSAWHADREGLARRIRELPQPVAVTASVTAAVYRR